MTLTSKQANHIIETYQTLQATQLVPQALGCEDRGQDCTRVSHDFSLQYAATLTLLEGDKEDRGSSDTERLHAAADEACTLLANPALNLSSAHYCDANRVPLKATPAFYSDTEKLAQTLLQCARATTPAACAAVGIGCRWSEKCGTCENPLAKQDADCPKPTQRPRFRYQDEPQEEYANQDDYGKWGHQDDGWGGYYH